MNQLVKEVLRKNYEELQSIQLTHELIAELYACGVITREHRDRLQGESNMEKINLLLEVLPYRGPVAFGRFVDALRKDHSYTASKLEADFKEKKSDSQDQTRPEDEEDNESLPEDRLNQPYQTVFASVPTESAATCMHVPNNTQEAEEDVFRVHSAPAKVGRKRKQNKNYKSWLREQWEFLRDHLKDHHYVSTDDRNFRTISFDSTGNLIKMTVQMCKKKLEEKNSSIKELTRENADLRSELLMKQNKIKVSEYDLQNTKQLLNIRNEENADLRQKLSVTPSPGARVPGSN